MYFICCLLLKDPPGFGVSVFSRSHITKTSSIGSFIFFAICGILFSPSSGRHSVTSFFILWSSSPRRCNCSWRHCCRFIAATPAGSNVRTSSISCITCSFVSPTLSTISSTVSVRYPRSSRLSRINLKIFSSLSLCSFHRNCDQR